jgi:hypothetical protein
MCVEPDYSTYVKIVEHDVTAAPYRNGVSSRSA